MAGTILLATGRLSDAATIGVYEFTGANQTGDASVPVVANATFSPFSRENLAAVNAHDQFGSRNYSSSSEIDLGQYVEFTVTADPGYRLDLESISFKHTRQDMNPSRTGPRKGEVRASFEGFGPGSGTGSSFSPVTSQTSSTWNFDDHSTVAGGSATFRFYGWDVLGSQTANMQLLLDDVSLFGEIVRMAPLVNDAVIGNVTSGDLVTHLFTADEPDGDLVTWNDFLFSSYTPDYGGAGTGPAIAATFNPETQQIGWNSLGSPRGIYEWRVTASDKDGSHEGSLIVHVVAVPEPAGSLLLLLGLGALAGYASRSAARRS